MYKKKHIKRKRKRKSKSNSIKLVIPLAILVYMAIDKLFITKCYGPCLQHCCIKYYYIILLLLLVNLYK